MPLAVNRDPRRRRLFVLLWRRSVSLLHLLGLLLVSLLQLLGLLLMLLFGLLFASIVGSFRRALIFLLLLLLQFLALFVLLGRQLVLLLLVLFVEFRIASIRRCGMLHRRQIFGVSVGCGVPAGLPRVAGFPVIGGRIVGSSGFSRGHYVMIPKCVGLWGRGDGWPAMVGGGLQFRIPRAVSRCSR